MVWIQYAGSFGILGERDIVLKCNVLEHQIFEAVGRRMIWYTVGQRKITSSTLTVVIFG